MDEPYLKAKFHLHISHYKDQKATSNTPVESVQKESDTYYITFRRTPRMSTYLVGWAVHNFVAGTITNFGRFQDVDKRLKFHGSMALNRGWAVYSTLQTWLIIESPLVKVDQFAIPDFNFNAMENWNLITYRESVVLHEDETPRRKVVNGLSVMVHEYAHSAYVIRMISHMIGSTTFQLGLQNYLRELSFEAATPFDLYRHLQAASNITRQLYKGIFIKDVIESWANQPEYLLVIIHETTKRRLSLPRKNDFI
ncbi:PREDICTED: aminopeptidase N-like [Atta colombica]|uniref:aminopeptidase N-like n=1 Tax=Atta colombica TaxID=520822 RepID=UPI00084BEA7D|nr:PREDICTED: aminopeptidase N-like [Atta colombica]